MGFSWKTLWFCGFLAADMKPYEPNGNHRELVLLIFLLFPWPPATPSNYLKMRSASKGRKPYKALKGPYKALKGPSSALGAL